MVVTGLVALIAFVMGEYIVAYLAVGGFSIGAFLVGMGKDNENARRRWL